MTQNLIRTLSIAIVLAIGTACGTSNKQTQEVKNAYTVNSVYDEVAKVDTAFSNLINSYKIQLDDQMNAVISVSDEAMMTGKPESKLSNYIADAMLEIGRTFCKENDLNHSVDFVVMNMGGIRTAMPKGEISTGRVFEMLPFKNKLVVVGMKGSDVKVLIDQLAEFGGEGVSGLRMGIKNEKAVDVLINDKAIDDSKIYHVMSVDYLVNGGGGFTAFENRETFRHLHKKLRSEIIKYMSEKYQQGQNISSKFDGRIYHVE
ncbi:hypothetical protein GCQ56_10810 [Marinifilum sp. N1E240]|uniref:5'-nucleotidase C-terminal domain-containing protein n=1 Tax=Marinifilum sp. N1E240 TaxID=2608082 RepID=UPI00128D95D0|nr:5'-nucleotidase [Marinifilum sp. N1E240]MPQ47494.1 hypothetical protein [Marinifilum sp. N1E240]